MKKVLLLLIIITGASQLKAQQKLNSVDSMLFKAPKNFKPFKLNDSLFRSFNPTKQNQLALLSSLGKLNNSEVFYSRMPVIKLSPSEKMPTAHGIIMDNMPVLKVKVVDPLAVVKPVNP